MRDEKLYFFRIGVSVNGKTSGLQNRDWEFESLRPCQKSSLAKAKDFFYLK